MLSIVICSIDAAKFARVTANYAERFDGVEHEIVGIHDARSLSEGYNRGWRRARGETILFSHDDVAIRSADPAGALARAFESLDVVGLVGTTRVVNMYWPAAGNAFLRGWAIQAHPVDGRCRVHVYGVDGAISAGLQALDGFFFATRRDVVSAVPFDEATFDGFHGYDIDFTFSAYRAGWRVGTTAEIAVTHTSAGGYDDVWQGYARRFQRKHGDVLPAEYSVAPWDAARIDVPDVGAIARIDVPQLVDITRKHRAARTKGWSW